MCNLPSHPRIVSRFLRSECCRRPIGVAAALFFLVALTPAARAGLYGTQPFTFPTGTTELNDGTVLASTSAAVASVQGNALRLVQNGMPEVVSSFKIPELDPGFPVSSFDVTLRLRMSATSTPADGWSINFGAIPAGNGGGEGGFAMPNGIVIAWDTYDNTGDPPSIEVFCNGVSVGNFPQTFVFDNTYRNVRVQWDANGLDVTVNNVAICTNLATPGFTPAAGNRFAFSARTGGLTQDVYIDDLRILTTPSLFDTGGPIISEFLAENRNAFEDEDVETPDWIEIYNGQNTAVDLSGWHLTNAEGEPALWTFPAITIAPYQYRIIYASGKNRTPATGQLHTNFTLPKEGGYVALTRPDNSVASAFNYGPQAEDVSFGERGVARTLGFLETPTPGALNSSNQAPGLPAEDVVFSRNGGLITAAVSVSIAPPANPAAVVRYTTNNTVPTESSPAYSGPFSISGNTTIRARVFAPGQLPGNVSSRTFLLLHSTLTNYNGSGQIFSSNLPIIVLDSFGVPVDSYADPAAPRPFRLTYAAVIDRDPATGRASLDGPLNYEGRSATHVRGESSSGFAQKQYSWEIWDEKHNDNDVSLLGLPAESDWILYGPYTDKTLMRNFIVYSQMLALNGDGSAMRTRFCEVFFNQATSSSISYSSYRGVYVLIEKIKRTNDRVDIAKLNNLTTDPNLITGGYIFKKDKPSPGNTAINLTSGQGFLAHDPEILNNPQRDYLRTYLNSFDAALNGANFADPVNGYAKFIDPLSFIDNQWFVEIAKQIDGYRISAYFSKDRGGKISALPLWDYNLSLGNADYLTGENPQGWYYPLNSFPAYYWYPRLRQDPNYMQLHWDRYWQMRRGQFATNTILAEIDAQAALLLNGNTALIGNNAPLLPPATESPVARHYRKYRILGTYVWPNAPGSQQRIYYKSGNPLTAEIDHMKDWLTKRLAWIDNQNFTGTRIYRPPTFNQLGGNVPADFSLEITPYTGTPPAGFTYATGDIYYTSDGSDPRGLNGAIAGTLYTGPLTLTSSAKIKARLYTPGTPTAVWSPITSANFIVNAVPASATNLVVTELNYHPLPPTDAERAINPGFAEGDFEFMEIKNIGSATVDLTAARFTAGIDFTFQGDNAIGLAPGAHVILAANPAGFAARYGAHPNVVGGFLGDLDNGGERLLLVAQGGGTILDFIYDDGWHLSTDGAGQTLVTYEQGAAGEAFSTPTNWRPSMVAGGSPGSDEPPFVATLDASAVTATSVQLNAEVSPNGTATTLEFVLGTDRHATPGIPAANSVTLVGQTINGLAPHTLYSYRAEAVNSIGVRAGTEVMFTTLNREPVPLADELHFPQRTPFTGAVLASDTDPDGDALTIISVTQGQFGEVSTDGTNVFYVPSDNYSGNDIFSYTVSDGFGGEESAGVTLRNAAPVAAEDLLATNGEEVSLDPRTNDTDADNDPLTVSAVTQGSVGTVAINAAGSITYTPGAQFFGRDTFAYTVTDGVAVATQNVVVRSNSPISVVRASSGQQIPGAPAGTVFGRLGAPSSSSFLGIVQTGGNRERAIFASDGRMRLKVGDPAPGVAGAFIAQLQEPSGQAVVATLSGSGINESNNSALYVDLNESAPPRLAIREGDPLPGSITLKRFLSIDGNGSTLFVRAALGGPFVQKTNDVALLAVPPGTAPSLLAREGDLVLGRPITLLGTLIGSRGTLAEGRWRTGAEAIGVRLSFPGKAHALYSIPANAASSAEWTEWAKTGDSAGTGTVQSFGLPGFSPEGVSYRAELALGSAPGVVKASDTLILRATSAGVDLLAAESAPVPGSSGTAVPGLFFKKFGDPVGGADSAAAFAATVAGSGVQASNSSGLWLAMEENVTMIARAGELAPGGGRWAKFESLALPDRAGSGPVFTATLAIAPSEGVTAANNRGLWAVDSTGALQLLLRTGTARPVNGSTRIIDKFVALAPASGSIGAARGVDDQGVVTVLVTFTDRTQALIGIALP